MFTVVSTTLGMLISDAWTAGSILVCFCARYYRRVTFSVVVVILVLPVFLLGKK